MEASTPELSRGLLPTAHYLPIFRRRSIPFWVPIRRSLPRSALRLVSVRSISHSAMHVEHRRNHFLWLPRLRLPAQARLLSLHLLLQESRQPVAVLVSDRSLSIV